jgi:hypothetical protein
VLGERAQKREGNRIAVAGELVGVGRPAVEVQLEIDARCSEGEDRAADEGAALRDSTAALASDVTFSRSSGEVW